MSFSVLIHVPYTYRTNANALTVYVYMYYTLLHDFPQDGVLSSENQSDNNSVECDRCFKTVYNMVIHTSLVHSTFRIHSVIKEFF